MMGEAQAPGGLGKARAPAGHHDLSAPALLGSACSTPSPRGRLQHGGSWVPQLYSQGQEDSPGHTVGKPGQTV